MSSWCLRLIATVAVSLSLWLAPSPHAVVRAQAPTPEVAAPAPDERLGDIDLRGLHVPGRVHRSLPNELRIQIDRGTRVRRVGLIFFGITGVAVGASTGAFVYCLGSPRAHEMFGCMMEGTMMLMTAGSGILVSSVLMGVGRRRLADARAQVELLAPELSLDARRVGLVLRVRR